MRLIALALMFVLACTGALPARAEIAAGLLVANANVVDWLKKVGTTKEAPMPTEWLK